MAVAVGEDRSDKTSNAGSTAHEEARSVGVQLVSELGTPEVVEASVERHVGFAIVLKAATVLAQAADIVDWVVELVANPESFD